MSIKTKIAAVALAALAVTGGIVTTTSQAEAKPIGWAIGAGIATAAIVGTAVAASSQPYYYGYHCCGWVAQYNAFGQYVGNVRTCY
ncbi:hypothetical protein AB8Z38_20750 [Bradyrhizobium sp. LLZ17]|uniref:Uncharacterized protein n=1 Tax=Bradyrhizobium sp. LLZ17 TaxID=3239388 RepID=A0AB39XBJ5_9BRAD